MDLEMNKVAGEVLLSNAITEVTCTHVSIKALLRRTNIIGIWMQLFAQLHLVVYMGQLRMGLETSYLFGK